MGRFLILAGLVIAGAGLLMTLGFPLGRLPGDFAIQRGNFSFYFPLATSILVSLLLTLVMMFFGRRKREKRKRTRSTRKIVLRVLWLIFVISWQGHDALD